MPALGRYLMASFSMSSRKGRPPFLLETKRGSMWLTLSYNSSRQPCSLRFDTLLTCCSPGLTHFPYRILRRADWCRWGARKNRARRVRWMLCPSLRRCPSSVHRLRVVSSSVRRVIPICPYVCSFGQRYVFHVTNLLLSCFITVRWMLHYKYGFGRTYDI